MHRFVVLLFLLAWGVAGCSSSKETTTDPIVALRTTVEETITDPDTEAQMLVYVNRVEEDLAELFEVTQAYEVELDQLARDYTSSREDFDARFEVYVQERYAIRDRIVATQQAMKALVPADQWRAIAKAEQKAITQVLNARIINSLDAN